MRCPSIEGDGGIAESKQSCQFVDGRSTGQRSADTSYGLPDLFNGASISIRPEVSDSTAKNLVGVPNHLDEAAGVPAGKLTTTVLCDKEYKGASVGIDDTDEGLGGGEIGRGKVDPGLEMRGGRLRECGELEVVVDEAELTIVNERAVVKARMDRIASTDSGTGEKSERGDAAPLIGGSGKDQRGTD
jgi:hypothetical protein